MSEIPAPQDRTTANPSIQPAIGELERCFSYLGQKLWCAPRDIRLPSPLITIQPGKGSHGWFCGQRWQRKLSGERIPELNIAAEHLAARPVEIAHTMLHEMVHLACWYAGERDCTSNQYHNKLFRRECENVGLIAKNHHDGRGWSHTELTPELEFMFEEMGLVESAFSYFRPDVRRPASTGKLRKRETWVCECKGANSVQRVATKPLSARCLVCGAVFIRSTELLGGGSPSKEVLVT